MIILLFIFYFLVFLETIRGSIAVNIKFRQRQDPHKNFTDHIGALQYAPIPRIGRSQPVVPQYYIFIVFQSHGFLAADDFRVVRIGQSVVRQIRFIQNNTIGMFGIINRDVAVVYFNLLSGQADDPFNKKLLPVLRIAKHYNLPALGFFEMVGQFINDQVLSVLECWIHAGTRNNERLKYKISDRQDNYKRDDDNFQKIPKEKGRGAETAKKTWV